MTGLNIKNYILQKRHVALAGFVLNNYGHNYSDIAHLLVDYAFKNLSTPIAFIALPSAQEMEMHPDDFE